MNRKIGISLLIGFLAISIIIIIVLLINPLYSLFNISIETERIKVEMFNTTNSRIILDGVDLYKENDLTAFRNEYSCDVLLQTNTTLLIERVAKGIARITIEHPDSVQYAEPYQDTFMNGSKRLVIEIDSLDWRAEIGETVTIPVNGKVEIGKVDPFRLRDSSPAILRGGTVTIGGISSWFGENFNAGKFELQLGDALVLQPAMTRAYGIIVINEKPGLQATFWAKADKARILRLGATDETGGFEISASRLDRLTQGPLSTMTSMIFATILILLTIFTFILDVISFFKTNI